MSALSKVIAAADKAARRSLAEIIRQLDEDRRTTEQFVQRVSDLLRRGGTEDAEHLVVELERRLRPKPFSIEPNFTFTSTVRIPAGAHAVEEYIELWSPAASSLFTSLGSFPMDVACHSAHAVTSTAFVPEYLEVRFFRTMLERARWPLSAWCGGVAEPFLETFREGEPAQLRLVFPNAVILEAPVDVAFIVNGTR